jgi:hypothetical protein
MASKWVIRSADTASEPLPTEEVLSRIRAGLVGGSAAIQEHPGGDAWAVTLWSKTFGEGATKDSGALNDDAFNIILSDARSRLGYFLGAIHKEWGPRDFPQDGGKAMRDFLFIYGDSFGGLAMASLSPTWSDPWIRNNVPEFLTTTHEQFLRLIGLGCLHSQMLRWHQRICALDRRHRGRVSQEHLALLSKELNWIYASYDLPSDCASAWYRILQETDGRSSDEYWELSESCMARFIAMLTPLGDSDAGSVKEWSGFGVHADLETRKQNPEWISQASEQFFRRQRQT